jgi:hypothetical protein
MFSSQSFEAPSTDIALTSLFDEDAEFVNVTGVCSRDDGSIRKARAYGLERIFNKSTMATLARKPFDDLFKL